MTEAATPQGQSLIDDFGAEQHEIGPMIDHFLEMAHGFGLPLDEVTPVERWLIAAGINPDNVWRAALVRARFHGVSIH